MVRRKSPTNRLYNIKENIKGNCYLKFSRLEYDQKLLEVEGSYTDKVSRLEKEMSKLKEIPS